MTWEAVSWRGWGLELGAEPCKAKSSSSETMGEDGFASLGRENEAFIPSSCPQKSPPTLYPQGLMR